MNSAAPSTPTITTTIMLDSPIGRLAITADEHALRRIDHFETHHTGDRENAVQDVDASGSAIAREALDQLRGYFEGVRTMFDLPIKPIGTTFEQKVWSLLCAIPFGETRSYADLARALGDERSVRAVGRANGRNPISIVVPCHRVIGSDGSLTGYAGGLDRKAALLRHEGVLLV